MNYCPETVIVHSAFLLAESLQSLTKLEKGKGTRAVQIVSRAIKEITGELLVDDKGRLLPVEVRTLEFKIHSWIFASLLKAYGGLKFDDSREEEYFDSFPPLPGMGVGFYLELLQDVGWNELLVECLCAFDGYDTTSLLEDIIKDLIQEPSSEDLSLFLCLFNSLLVSRSFHRTSVHEDNKLNQTCQAKSCSLLLLEGVTHLRKKFVAWPAAQLDMMKNVIDFVFTEVTHLNFELDSSNTEGNILCGICWLQNHVSCKHQPFTMEEDKVNDHRKTFGQKSEHKKETEAFRNHKARLDVVVSGECTACISFLCQAMINDWSEVSHWIQGNVNNNSIGELDSSSWLPLHRWMIKLYTLAWFIESCTDDGILHKQAEKLQTGLAQYVKKHATEAELEWIDGFKWGELIGFEESCFEEEFSSPLGSVDLLLFQAESTEDQFHFYLQRVNNRLEGYKECFDWLLSTEEFHGDSDWLECMRNHAVEISEAQHALKMIDIIYMQRQSLCADNTCSDVVYKELKEILLTLHSNLPHPSQEQIIEYAFLMSSSLPSPENDSIFFHPWFMAEETVNFQLELVLTFNKVIDCDIAIDGQLKSSTKDLTKAALISVPLTLNKAVQEGVKSIPHTKAICSVLQKLPNLCQLQYNKSSSRTLLCQALLATTVNVSSRQQESNLLNMVAVMLTANSTQLLDVQEFIQAVVLPFLNNSNMDDNIPAALALKLLNTAMEPVSVSVDLLFLKKYSLTIILCLCELLNDCNAFWESMAPEHSLIEMEELKELVLKALDIEIKICLEVIKINPSFARALEWLLKRMKDGFDWTIPLYLEELFITVSTMYKLSIPPCLLMVCWEPGDKWTVDKDLPYGPEDVFTVLFEYCRVSDSALECVLERFVSNKLPGDPEDIRIRVVTSLLQILPHCTWKEWNRILAVCQFLLKRRVFPVCSSNGVSCLEAEDDDQNVCELSSLLLDMMEALRSPSCSSWATPHVWLYVIKHYITAIKEAVNENTNAMVTASVFGHLCHVMTFAPVACLDQLFVLSLNLVTRPSVSSSDVIERMKMSINRLSSQVHKAALMQKLNQSK